MASVPANNIQVIPAPILVSFVALLGRCMESVPSVFKARFSYQPTTKITELMIMLFGKQPNVYFNY